MTEIDVRAVKQSETQKTMVPSLLVLAAHCCSINKNHVNMFKRPEFGPSENFSTKTLVIKKLRQCLCSVGSVPLNISAKLYSDTVDAYRDGFHVQWVSTFAGVCRTSVFSICFKL